MTGNRVHVRLRSVRRPFMPLSCTGPYRMPYTRNGTLEPAFPSGSPALPRGRQRCSFSCSLLKKLESLVQALLLWRSIDQGTLLHAKQHRHGLTCAQEGTGEQGAGGCDHPERHDGCADRPRLVRGRGPGGRPPLPRDGRSDHGHGGLWAVSQHRLTPDLNRAATCVGSAKG